MWAGLRPCSRSSSSEYTLSCRIVPALVSRASLVSKTLDPDLTQEIDSSGPDTVGKDGLVHDVDAIAHRSERRLRAFVSGGRDLQTLGSQMVEVCELVRAAALAQVLDELVAAHGARELAVSDAQIERRQVPAAEKIAEVRGRENQPVGDAFHRIAAPCRS
jgi:hypothetical protein